MIIKKFICITKIDDNLDGSARCIKHHVNNLIKYVNYLDKKWPEWKWMNVYDKNSGNQIANFTQKKPPVSGYLFEPSIKLKKPFSF